MKKKHRDITVDNVKYGWTINYYTLSIWKDKKIIINKDVTHCTITPKIVAEYIKEYNESQI